MKEKTFKAIIERDENGFFVASVPALPGCHTQGKTVREALLRLREAAELCLEVENLSYNDVYQPNYLAVKDLVIA